MARWTEVFLETWSRRNSLAVAVVCFLLLVWGSPVRSTTHTSRPPILRDVAFEQRLDRQIPLGLSFRDETGGRLELRDYFGRRPVILVPAYYHCQDLCPLTLDGLVRALRALSFDAGRAFDVLVVSFDPSDTPALAMTKKGETVRRYARDGASGGWHFLTGDRGAIAALTESLGFHAVYEADRKRYAHAAGVTVLTPQGRISRYFYGIDFSPRDLRLGLVEASANRIGSAIDQLLLFCYHYDPTTGKYGLLITHAVRSAAAVTVLVLAGGIIGMLVRERTQARGKGDA